MVAGEQPRHWRDDLFDLEPGDLDGAVAIAQAAFDAGELTREILHVLARSVDSTRALFNELTKREISVNASTLELQRRHSR